MLHLVVMPHKVSSTTYITVEGSDADLPVSEMVHLRRMNTTVPHGGALEFVRGQILEIFRGQEAAAVNGKQKGKLKDCREVIAAADLSRFVERDQAAWLPLLKKAKTTLEKEFEEARGLLAYYDKSARDEEHDGYLESLYQPRLDRLNKVKEDLSLHEKLMADLQDHLDDAV